MTWRHCRQSQGEWGKRSYPRGDSNPSLQLSAKSDNYRVCIGFDHSIQCECGLYVMHVLYVCICIAPTPTDREVQYWPAASPASSLEDIT